MTNSKPHRATSHIIWHVVVGWTLGFFVANLLGTFLVQVVHLVRGQSILQHLIQFSLSDRLLLVSFPIVSAAMLVRKRLFVSLGMLLAAAVAWGMTGV